MDEITEGTGRHADDRTTNASREGMTIADTKQVPEKTSAFAVVRFDDYLTEHTTDVSHPVCGREGGAGRGRRTSRGRAPQRTQRRSLAVLGARNPPDDT